MTISPQQCKAARELLKWTLLDLGYRARVSEKTVSRFEAAQRIADVNKVEAIRRTLEAAGIIFDEDGRVRLREGK
jgi:transcriptional regulator with XRE-family HTH domain